MESALNDLAVVVGHTELAWASTWSYSKSRVTVGGLNWSKWRPAWTFLVCWTSYLNVPAPRVLHHGADDPRGRGKPDGIRAWAQQSPFQQAHVLFHLVGESGGARGWLIRCFPP
jgi:hypothetical protein